MEYTKKYNELKSIFDPCAREINIPGSYMKIVNINFTSDIVNNAIANKKDIGISENSLFSYPVFVPANRNSKKAILLLHGLNERSWIKYLTWAYYLSLLTESYVILFPISFHINRSPDTWKDPRAMLGFMNERKMVYGKINMTSIANIALSTRLTEDPLRFFNSGYQTVCDIVKLLTLVKSGKHEIIPQGSKVNVFAYSIGAFLAQIIFMGNPRNLLTESRLYMFCGGSVFSNMQGTSKLIMDGLAYEKVYKYYMADFEKETKGKSLIVDFLRSGRLGMAFRSMIDSGRFFKFREKILNNLKDRIHTIALSKDTVIPPKGIVDTLKGQHVEVWDFPFPYSHENPFPVYGEAGLSKEVDTSFERLILSAGLFLA